ncbi:MAG TPA: response regulator [Aggregatilineales bacterium]|nr:response regulator [Aggregatilineales bacterium]
MSSQPNVLYVEDDPQSRRIIQMILVKRMALQNVTILENSLNFQTVVSTLDPKPNLIFLDIHMQPHDGFEMLAMLRQLEWSRHIPIIALTASVMSEEIQQLRTAGFSGCLAKPIDLQTFPETFNQILAGKTIWRITT